MGNNYTAEDFLVLNTGEKGFCVKLGDDTVCDVWTGEEDAKRIATALNFHQELVDLVTGYKLLATSDDNYPLHNERAEDLLRRIEEAKHGS